MMDFKIGDVVVLRSGGPLMTIHNIGDYSNAGFSPGLLCVWFDDKKKVEAVFHPDAVEAYTDG